MREEAVRGQFRRAFHVRELVYPSNLLSLARVVLLVPTLHYLRRPEQCWQAVAWMSAAMLTDAIDGPLARRRGEVSMLGKILDPLADKMVIDTIAVTLSQHRGFPWWVTRLLIFRDVGILLAAWVLYKRSAQLAVSQTAGKLSTVGLSVAMLLYTIDREHSGKPVLYITLLPFGLSFWQYSQQFFRLLRHK
jgi:CDP-diacylglycerol--glycerol-3-phosphate 3-phosphatidyltransferase